MIDSELLLLEDTVYNNCSLKITNVILHDESKEYNACSFLLNDDKIIFRKAKITPKKVGQFVTFWKRSNFGPIEPFHVNDDFDFFVVNCTSVNNFGQFVFPKGILIEKGIVSSSNKEGKRAFRVYPIWETPTSKQAEKTQNWQKEHFISLTNNIDFNDVKKKYLK